MMNRAYSLLNIKQVKEDQRIILGTATTPAPDRMGDIVDPLGVKFKNPLRLLWHHDTKMPVGEVFFKKPTKNGIDFEAKLPHVVEPGPLKDRVDTAWGEVKYGLVRGVSIGFRSLEHSLLDDGGTRFVSSEVLELSLVAIPAQEEATISAIKSFDAEHLAASGRTSNGNERSTSAGASATKLNPVVKAQEAKRTMAKQTIAEQISAYEATRQAKAARMTEIMDVSAENGETLDEAQTEEYDGLKAQLKSVDDHLHRLNEMSSLNLAKASTIEVTDQKSASDARGGISVQIRSPKLPKATTFTRYVMALTRARGNVMQAYEIAKNNEQWHHETPDVETILRTAVAAGSTTDTTWAGPLVVYQNMTSEFIDLLDPMTIIGRIPGLNRVPFKIKIPRLTSGATVNWVGEGRVKPLTSLAFDTVEMEFNKIAGIIPLTEELVRFSNPAAEALVRNRLTQAITAFMDREFIDPTKAATDVSPASITNGVTPTTATGTTAAALRADIKTVFSGFLANNMSPATAVWIMTSQQALAISMMTNSLGQAQFPGITMQGGTLVGVPVIVSENIPGTGGSPTDGGLMILVSAQDILLADDGNVTIDASREASLQMDTAPDSPPTTSTTYISMFQQNMVAIKAERFITWKKARDTAVSFIDYAKYAE